MRILILFFLISISLSAQDTIRFINNEIKVVKISEVGVENVKYKNFNNIDGPQYIVPKNEVKSVRYSSGLYEEYNKTKLVTEPRPIDLYEAEQAKAAAAKKEAQKNAVPLPPPPKDTTFYKLDYIAGKVIYKNRPLSERALFNLAYDYPNKNTQIKLIEYNEKLKKHKKRQIGFLIGGLAGAGAILYGGLYFAFVNWAVAGNDPPDGLIPAVIGTAVVVGIGGPVISGINKNKRKTTKQKIVKLYNEGR